MRGLAAPVVVLLALIGAVGCTSGPRSRGNDKIPDGYVSLSAIGKDCGLAYTVEGNGKGVLTGDGQRVVVRDGLSVAVVNGNQIPLSGAAHVEGMDAKVPKDSAQKIAAALAGGFRPPPDPERSGGKEARRQPGPSRAITIVIDPGHGGKFDGAKARNGLEEKKVNLEVARLLRDALTKMGFRVLMTRESDREVAKEYRNDLDARVRLAERSKADLFISIHSNANNNAGVVGFEVYRSRAESRKEVEARIWKSVSTANQRVARTPAALYDLNRIRTAAFADEIRTSMRSTRIPDRGGVREAGFHVIKWAPCPAVLVEMDYLSNTAGAQRLGNSAMRQKIADALAGGVARFASRLDRIGVK